MLIKNYAHTTKHTDCLTCKDGGHECSKHEKQHGEEQEASVVEHFAGIIPNVQVQQTNQHADTQV